MTTNDTASVVAWLTNAEATATAEGYRDSVIEAIRQAADLIEKLEESRDFAQSMCNTATGERNRAFARAAKYEAALREILKWHEYPQRPNFYGECCQTGTDTEGLLHDNECPIPGAVETLEHTDKETSA